MKTFPEHPVKILFLLPLASVPTSLGKYQVINPFANKAAGLGRFKEYQIHREHSRGTYQIHIFRKATAGQGLLATWPICRILA